MPEGAQLLPAPSKCSCATSAPSLPPSIPRWWKSAGSDVVNDLFEGLYTLDGNGKLQAGAYGYELDATGTVYTFKLRPDAKWSNGEPVTAADYVYGWQRAADPKNASNYAWFIELTGVANASDVVQGKQSPDALGIKALDDYTLQITLKTRSPSSSRPSPLHHLPGAQATIEKFGRGWVKPATSSPTAPSPSRSGPRTSASSPAQPHYWDNEHTVLNKVIYLEIVSDTAAYNRYRAERAALHHLSPGAVSADQAPEPGGAGERPHARHLLLRLFNTQRKPFDDVRVRHSLCHRPDTITEDPGTGAALAFSLTPPSVDGFELKRPASELMSREERIKQAKALARRGGLRPDKPLTVDILYNTNRGTRR